MHTLDVRVTKVSSYKCFHFLLMCSARQKIAYSERTTLDRGWLVQSDVVMLAMFNTMFEMMKQA